MSKCHVLGVVDCFGWRRPANVDADTDAGDSDSEVIVEGVIFKVPRTFLAGDDLLCTSRTQASLLWPTKCCPEFKAFSSS